MQIRQVVVKVAQRCNLSCTYCYMYKHLDQSYRKKPAFISEGVFTALLQRMRNQAVSSGEQIALIFHGGEPLLLGHGRFDSLATEAREYLGEYLADIAIQTNAVLIDDEWLALFIKHDVRVSVSIDGERQNHDLVRIGHNGEGSYDNAIRGLKNLWASGIPASILCVINPEVDGVGIYRHFLRAGARRFNFLFPDACHDTAPFPWTKQSAAPIADYLIPVFDAWFESSDGTISIPLFEALVKNALEQKRGPAVPVFVVVDTDGTILLSDEYKVCGEGVGASGINVLSNNFNEADSALEYTKALSGEILLPSECVRCDVGAVCRGGSMPHRFSAEHRFDNPSVWCKDHYALVSHVIERVTADTGAVSY